MDIIFNKSVWDICNIIYFLQTIIRINFFICPWEEPYKRDNFFWYLKLLNYQCLLYIKRKDFIIYILIVTVDTNLRNLLNQNNLRDEV